MAINFPKPQGPSKAAGALLGFISGGGLGAGGMSAGLESAGKSLVKNSGGTAAPILSAIDTANRITEEPETPISDNNFKIPEIGSKYNPVENRLRLMDQDPTKLTNDALGMLKDPSVPQDLRDKMLEPLVRYKVYGYKSGGIA